MTENPHKLSAAELMQRKMAAKSKNEMAGKIAYQKKMEALQNGKLPKEYREIVVKEKKYTAKAAFLKDKTLEKEYENRSFATEE